MQAREEMYKLREATLLRIPGKIPRSYSYGGGVPPGEFVGSIRDVQGLYLQLGLRNSPQVCETLEHRMVVAEAAQNLRLPLISKDGEIQEDEAEKWSIVSRRSLDTSTSSVTISSSTNSTNFTNIGVGAANNSLSVGTTDALESEVGGVPNRFLGITPAYLWQTQHQQTDIDEYQVLLAREIGSRLDAKCNKLADAVVINDIDLAGHQNLTSRLPERAKLILEEIEREESVEGGSIFF